MWAMPRWECGFRNRKETHQTFHRIPVVSGFDLCQSLPDAPRSSRRTWMPKFLRAVTACRTMEEVDKLLRVKIQRWRGKPPIPQDADDVEEDSEDEKRVSSDDGLALLA